MNAKQIFWEFWFIEYTHTDADSPAMAASWRDVMRIFCITKMTWKARRQALSPLAPGPLHVKSCMYRGSNLTIFSNQHWTTMLSQLKFWLRRGTNPSIWFHRHPTSLGTSGVGFKYNFVFRTGFFYRAKNTQGRQISKLKQETKGFSELWGGVLQKISKNDQN